MIDLEHGNILELTHSPGSPVEPGPQDHELLTARSPNGIVDGHRAGSHHHGLGLPVFVPQSRPEAAWHARNPLRKYSAARVCGEQRKRGLVLETSWGEHAVGESTPAAHVLGRLARGALLHAP